MDPRPAPLVLLIEDEPQMRRFLRASLAATATAWSRRRRRGGLAQAAARNPDVVLLDLGLPDLDGLEVTRELREWSTTPIIVLSARGQEHDKVAALDAGADDYLTKPFGVDELLARMRVALRHAAAPARARPSPGVRGRRAAGGPGRAQVLAGARRCTSRRPSTSCSRCWSATPGKVLTHRQLLKEVWGPTHVDQTHYLRVYMAPAPPQAGDRSRAAPAADHRAGRRLPAQGRIGSARAPGLDHGLDLEPSTRSAPGSVRTTAGSQWITAVPESCSVAPVSKSTSSTPARPSAATLPRVLNIMFPA